MNKKIITRGTQNTYMYIHNITLFYVQVTSDIIDYYTYSTLWTRQKNGSRVSWEGTKNGKCGFNYLVHGLLFQSQLFSVIQKDKTYTSFSTFFRSVTIRCQSQPLLLRNKIRLKFKLALAPHVSNLNKYDTNTHVYVLCCWICLFLYNKHCTFWDHVNFNKSKY